MGLASTDQTWYCKLIARMQGAAGKNSNGLLEELAATLPNHVSQEWKAAQLDSNALVRTTFSTLW
jgi:hypothetical protein